MCCTPCSLQDSETGAYHPCLAPEALEAMYGRITEHEIVLPSKGARGTLRGTGESQGMRLAAAVGLTQLLLPFRFCPHESVSAVLACASLARSLLVRRRMERK